MIFDTDGICMVARLCEFFRGASGLVGLETFSRNSCMGSQIGFRVPFYGAETVQ